MGDDDGPILGIVDQPYIGERFIGGLGLAEVTGPMGRAPLAARRYRPLDQAILFSTFPEIGTTAERAAQPPFHAHAIGLGGLGLMS